MPPIPESAYVPIPYAPRERYVADTRTLGAILQQQGENQQRLALARGANAAQMWQALGQVFANYQQTQQQNKALAQRKAEQDADRDYRTKKDEDAVALQREALIERQKAGEAQRAAAEQAAADKASAMQRQTALDVDARVAPGIGSPDAVDALKAYPGTAPRVQLQDGVNVIMRTPAQKQQADAAARADAAAQAAAERQAATFGETKRHNQAMESRPVAGPAAGLDIDPAAIGEAIIRGEREPDTGNLGRGPAAAVDTYLARAGYNKAAAVTDWKATNRHLATLNGAQQTRLRQAVVTAHDSLDVIDDLASKWQGGKFPVLNKASLSLAKNGAYGPEAASIATQLEGQITDVVSELGNVYMGGNSPTDHALKLAGKNLSADWDQKVLKDMTKLARTNLQIRKNSMENVGAVLSQPDSGFADKASPGADKPADLVYDPKTKTFKKAGG